MSQERITKEAFNWRLDGSWRVDKPKDTRIRTIERERNERNLDRVYVKAMADNRDAWKSFVADLFIT